jgi:hypothetical protein
MINLLTNAQHILQSTEEKEKEKENMRIQKCGRNHPQTSIRHHFSTFWISEYPAI